MVPDRLERQAAMMEADPGLSVCSCLVEFFADGEVHGGMAA